MTTVTVWSFISYLTSVEGVAWRPRDYDNNKMIKCLKGEPINGTFNVRTSKRHHVYSEQNRDDFVRLACAAAAKKALRLLEGNFSIVPVPNSIATKAADNDFRTLHLARQIAGSCNGRANVVPALRWNKPMQSSRKGGTRDPQVLFEKLEICTRTEKPVILFDDVLTSGAHLIACHRKLTASSMLPRLALTMGRTTHEQHEKPLEWKEEEVVLEEPPPLWLDDDF